MIPLGWGQHAAALDGAGGVPGAELHQSGWLRSLVVEQLLHILLEGPDEGEVAHRVSIESWHVHLGCLEDSHEPGLLKVQGLKVIFGRTCAERLAAGRLVVFLDMQVNPQREGGKGEGEKDEKEEGGLHRRI